MQSEHRFPSGLASDTLAPVRMSQLSYHTAATTRHLGADLGHECADVFRRECAQQILSSGARARNAVALPSPDLFALCGDSPSESERRTPVRQVRPGLRHGVRAELEFGAPLGLRLRGAAAMRKLLSGS